LTIARQVWTGQKFAHCRAKESSRYSRLLASPLIIRFKSSLDAESTDNGEWPACCSIIFGLKSKSGYKHFRIPTIFLYFMWKANSQSALLISSRLTLVLFAALPKINNPYLFIFFIVLKCNYLNKRNKICEWLILSFSSI